MGNSPWRVSNADTPHLSITTTPVHLYVHESFDNYNKLPDQYVYYSHNVYQLLMIYTKNIIYLYNI